MPTVAATRGDLNAWWRVGLPIAAAFERVLFRVRVAGIHHVPSPGPAILAFDHVSVLDGPVPRDRGGVAAPRAVRFFVAAEIFAQPGEGLVPAPLSTRSRSAAGRADATRSTRGSDGRPTAPSRRSRPKGP